MTPSDQTDSRIGRICSGCGQVGGPGIFPVGWEISPIYGPAGGSAFAAIVVGERPLCPDCQEADHGE